MDIAKELNKAWIKWTENGDWKYNIYSDTQAYESVSIDDLFKDNIPFASILLSLLTGRTKKYQIGDYSYEIYSTEVWRTSPKIPKPNVSKLGYNIVKTFKKVVA